WSHAMGTPVGSQCRIPAQVGRQQTGLHARGVQRIQQPDAAAIFFRLRHRQYTACTVRPRAGLATTAVRTVYGVLRLVSLVASAQEAAGFQPGGLFHGLERCNLQSGLSMTWLR